MLVIKFQNVKRKIHLIKQLNQQEVRLLIGEGIITILAMVLIYLGAVYMFQKIIYQDASNIAFVWRLMGINEDVIDFSQNVFIVLMTGLTVWITNWRLSRRYRQIELQHVLSELNYIAEGHYEHRISLDRADKLKDVVQSINLLVDNTVNAMEEERLVEKTKQELVTNVSHDIRTPLTSIIGYLSLIRDKQYETHEELSAYVEIAYQKAQQMKTLADNLFEYATMQNGSEQLDKHPVPLYNFFSQLAAEFDLESKENGMELIVSVPDKQLEIWIDPNKMVRVFNNLLSNAFKYSQATKVIISAEAFDNEVLIQVKNNGVPIEKDAIKQLFVRFYRENNTRNNKMSGSGLGLAIVESIIVSHKGRVSVTSDEQKTVFSIWLPLKDEEAKND